MRDKRKSAKKFMLMITNSRTDKTQREPDFKKKDSGSLEMSHRLFIQTKR